MNMTTAIEEKIKVFEASVSKAFKFLTDEYGLVKQKLRRVDFEYPKDERVEICFSGETICVFVQWYLIDANIGVGIAESVNKKIPDKYSFYNENASRAISLTDFVEYLTKGKVRTPLPEAKAGANVREIVRSWKERDKIITDDMDRVVVMLSDFLKRYASSVLAGDVSMFSEVQAFSRKKLGQ